MSATLLQQETQLRASLVADRDDNVSPSEANFETNAVSLLDDINSLSSAISNLYDGQSGDWFGDLNTPSALEAGSQRGVNDLNTALHAQEKARRLFCRRLLVDVAVGGSDNFVILGSGQLPSQLTAAVGTVTTKGTVVAAHGGTFGAHSLTEVVGQHALAPKNLLQITDERGDPILSDIGFPTPDNGRVIWGLLQGESGLLDGDTILISTPDRVQISFVRPNSTHTDFEACPAIDIQGKTIRYCYVERIAADEMTEQDWLGEGGGIDIGAGAGVISRKVAYDTQGTTPVDLVTNAILDLEAPGLEWQIRDDLEAPLLRVIEGSAGGTSEVEIAAAVDLFNCDAVDVDFANGVKADTDSASPVHIGVTDGHVETSAGDLHLQSAAEMFLDDVNQATSSWTGTDGIKLSDDPQEWTDFNTTFGEVSILSALVTAQNVSSRRRVEAVVTTNVAADVDVSGPSNDNNLDADLGDLSLGSFVDEYDFYLNGQYLRAGANAAANFDLYPGTSLANGQLKWEKKLKSGDRITVIDLAVLP